MPTVTHREASTEHEKFYQDFVALLKKYSHLDKYDQLALVANTLGKLAAIQDQRKHTSDSIMATIAKNIEIGNGQMLDSLLQGGGDGKAS